MQEWLLGYSPSGLSLGALVRQSHWLCLSLATLGLSLPRQFSAEHKVRLPSDPLLPLVCMQTKPGRIQPVSRLRLTSALGPAEGQSSPSPFQQPELASSPNGLVSARGDTPVLALPAASHLGGPWSTRRGWAQGPWESQQSSGLGGPTRPLSCLPWLSPQPQQAGPLSLSEDLPLSTKQAYKAMAAVPGSQLPLEPEVRQARPGPRGEWSVGPGCTVLIPCPAPFLPYQELPDQRSLDQTPPVSYEVRHMGSGSGLRAGYLSPVTPHLLRAPAHRASGWVTRTAQSSGPSVRGRSTLSWS